MAALAAGCLGRSPHAFVPKSVVHDRWAERTLAELQNRINAHDARGICALYASPSSRCTGIWRSRLDAFPTPIRFSIRRMSFGCAGDARLIFTESSARGERSRMLSLVSAAPGVYTLLIDFSTDSRRSSLIVPAYGSCATDGDHVGGIAADSLDHASTGTQGNGY